MKIHLKQIPLEGLHIEGDENERILEVEDGLFRALGPVRYSLDVGVSASGLFATGMLEVDLELECVTGLERFKYTLKVEDFAMQEELDGRETVDLTPYVREDILLALPPYPHCDWNGEHVCAGVQEKIADERKPGVPLSQVPVAWDELDKLKLKSK